MRAAEIEVLADVYAGAVRTLRLRNSLPFAEIEIPKGKHRRYAPVHAVALAAQKELGTFGVSPERAAMILRKNVDLLWRNWETLICGYYKLLIINNQSTIASAADSAQILAGASLAGARSMFAVDLADLMISICIRGASKGVQLPNFNDRAGWWRVKGTENERV